MCDFTYPLIAFKTWDIKLNITNVRTSIHHYLQSLFAKLCYHQMFLLYSTNVGHLDILPMSPAESDLNDTSV